MSKIKIAGYALIPIIAFLVVLDLFDTTLSLKEIPPYKSYLGTIDKSYLDIPRFEAHSDFDYTLRKKYNGVYGMYGGLSGSKLCTDKNGFRTHCDNLNRSSLSFDVVFIGDLYTEGVGLPYEDTLVGMYGLAHPSLKIANLGVAGYSPTRYLNKISYYLSKGLKTKHVIAIIDVDDIADEVPHHFREPSIYSEIRSFTHHRLRYTTGILEKLELSRFPSKVSLPPRWKIDWPYNSDQEGFGSIGVSGAIERSLTKMEELYDLLNQHNIKLSIGVYPWPYHLRNDGNKENLQVTIWKEFCKKRCFAFVNAFPAFLKLHQKLGDPEFKKQYLLPKRRLFNKKGNKIILKLLDDKLKIKRGK